MATCELLQFYKITLTYILHITYIYVSAAYIYILLVSIYLAYFTLAK